MNLFNSDPIVTDKDRQRIAPEISNTKFALQWLRTNPSITEVRKAILIELDDCRGPLRRGVLQVLLRRLRQLESSELEARIVKYLKSRK
jgi:hypothetical protein